MYETGGMRRTHLQGQKNILKRLLFHAIGFNLALLIRKSFGNRQTEDPAGSLGCDLTCPDRDDGRESHWIEIN